MTKQSNGCCFLDICLLGLLTSASRIGPNSLGTAGTVSQLQLLPSTAGRQHNLTRRYGPSDPARHLHPLQTLRRVRTNDQHVRLVLGVWHDSGKGTRVDITQRSEKAIQEKGAAAGARF